ncbi:hypothetical protein KZP23_08410 [Echinicola marina]|uniref:hypothetical protein n=1 Tax=Echinicola marina TaxID=2859768 RepID=UPI001CF6B598|nr:hypothetical protein [Echinicola marina]UCS95016.1 hypothetical protein KZP23_08410 [Echinicola marina]
MNYLKLKKGTSLSWKTKLLVYLATLLICVLAANFRTEIQQITGNSYSDNVEISSIEE